MTPIQLVTRLGECFEVSPQGQDRAGNRDGVLHYFHLTDLVKGRGLRKVSVYRGGPRDFYASSIAEFDRRIDTVLLNTLRHRFDSGELTFDVPEGATYYKEVLMTPEDFQPQPPACDEEVRQLMMHEAYWLSYRYGNPRKPRFRLARCTLHLSNGCNRRIQSHFPGREAFLQGLRMKLFSCP